MDSTTNSEQPEARRSLHAVVRAMSDEELFDAIREQVNKARNRTHGHDRAMTKAIGEEMVRRGWRNGPDDRTELPPTDTAVASKKNVQ